MGISEISFENEQLDDLMKAKADLREAMDRNKGSNILSDEVLEALGKYQEVLGINTVKITIPSELIEECEGITRQYLDKFGEHSLDRVIGIDPVHESVESYVREIEKLKEAIESGVPLEQMPQEVWDSIVF